MDGAGPIRELYTPPAVQPKRPGFLWWRSALSIFGNPLEGWPIEIYELPWWRPPAPGVVFVMDPQAIGQVMLKSAASFPQGELFKRVMSPVWGKGMVVAEGADWRWQRQAAAPAFRPDSLSVLTPAMTRAAEGAVERWRAAPGARLDIQAEMSRVTLDVVLDVILGGADELRGEDARALVRAFVAQAQEMRPSYFVLPDGAHRGRSNPPNAESRELRQRVLRMIAGRRTGPPRGDLVDLLIAAKDPESGRGMDDDLLADNLLGFIAAGHETSAVSLTWMLFLVGSHPPTAARLREEVRAVAGDEAISAEHIPSLTFTRQVIQEAQRLYPVPALVRVCTETTTMGDLTIRKGERVLIPIYVLHRHRKWWENPDAFDPDRWGSGKTAPDRHLYLPFGAGPRICMGAAFAMLEMTAILATLARAADFTPDPAHVIRPMYNAALIPQGGMPMTVKVAG